MIGRGVSPPGRKTPSIGLSTRQRVAVFGAKWANLPERRDGLRMLHHQTKNFGTFAAQLLLGSATLALLTLAFVPLHLDLALAAFAFLVAIVLSSLMGSFSASALLSVAAVIILNYFFAPPLFEFRIDTAQDATLLATFFFTSLTVTRLIRSAREQQEAALE